MHCIKPQILKSNGKQRSGRGFSLEELKQAGLNVAKAKRIEILVDKRRKTAHEQNINILKAYVERNKAEAKLKTKPAMQTKKRAKS